MSLFFFFQAEDGIRDGTVTGVQTCALPISGSTTVRAPVVSRATRLPPEVTSVREGVPDSTAVVSGVFSVKIGRASCRERVEILVVDVSIKKIKESNELTIKIERLLMLVRVE